ncbi:MAG TPA: fibronectin type III domain-containing protein [Terriglobia bacterium]|nr:fibronectin type III domain-containing protein [Terriglobia bacterium]
MSTTKTKPIRAMLGFTRTGPTDILARATAVYTGINGDTTDYVTPPVDMVTFKGAIDTYSSKITAAMDGGKKAIAERSHQGEVVIKMLRQLGHYVEANCNDDMPTFLKSGFEAASTAKGANQPLSQFIRKINQGSNSGQVLVTITAVPAAFSYELRWAAIGAGGTPGTWTTQPVSKTRPAASVTGLTPGTTYAFQVRCLGNASYSDWSDSVTRICT